jgi:hypothetical protein
MGHLKGIQASAVVNVNKVQTHGFVAYADFAGAGLAHRHIDEVHFFRATGFIEMNGFAHDDLLGTNAKRKTHILP